MTTYREFNLLNTVDSNEYFETAVPYDRLPKYIKNYNYEQPSSDTLEVSVTFDVRTTLTKENKNYKKNFVIDLDNLAKEKGLVIKDRYNSFDYYELKIFLPRDMQDDFIEDILGSFGLSYDLLNTEVRIGFNLTVSVKDKDELVFNRVLKK